jgi:hypothetical protein
MDIKGGDVEVAEGERDSEEMICVYMSRRNGRVSRLKKEWPILSTCMGVFPYDFVVTYASLGPFDLFTDFGLYEMCSSMIKSLESSHHCMKSVSVFLFAPCILFLSKHKTMTWHVLFLNELISLTVCCLIEEEYNIQELYLLPLTLKDAT